jgi:hypothetical protein
MRKPSYAHGMTELPSAKLRRRIRVLLLVFITGLVLSGLTAFPLDHELRLLGTILGIDPTVEPSAYVGVRGWIATVGAGLHDTYIKHPFVAYGTDWLAFAHLVIAVAFIGPLRDPIRNVWVVTFGLIACLGVIPLALIAGEIRQIPIWWRLIDCGFGVLGALPLWLVRRDIAAVQTLEGREGV